MEKPRVVYFDILNILAALSVVFLHCNTRVHFFTDTLAWRQMLFVETFCYWAVPIFLMLSGATLMNYRERYSTPEFFKKRFLKTVIPFVIWTLISIVDTKVNVFKIGERAFINRFFGSGFESIYWFFIPLFAVYISIPVLSLLKDNRQILWYMAGGAFLLNSLGPTLFRYIGLQWNGSLSMLTVGGMLLFPILGYLFSVTDFSKKQRIIIYALGLFGAVLRYTVTYILSVRDCKTNRLMFDYNGFYSIFLACAVFTFFKYFPLCSQLAASKKAVKVLKAVSSCSFGVYLMHMIIYRKLDDFIPVNSWQWQLLVPFLIYAIALGITYIIKKIPVLRNIVP